MAINEFNKESTITIISLARKIRNIEASLTGLRGLVEISETDIVAGYSAITFSSIPSGYSALFLTGVARSSKAAVNDTLYLRLNADVGNNYDFINTKAANGGMTQVTAVATSAITLGVISGANAPANTLSLFDITLGLYASTSINKPVKGYIGTRDTANVANLFTYQTSAWYISVNAITSLTLLLAADNFVAGGKMSLYGYV